MDVAKCAVASLIETAALLHYGNIGSQGLLRLVFALFLAQYVALKLYSIFVWPFLVSPLRHLPGPKVRGRVAP